MRLVMPLTVVLLGLGCVAAQPLQAISRGGLSVTLNGQVPGLSRQGELTFRRVGRPAVTVRSPGLYTGRLAALSRDGRQLAVLNPSGGYVQVWDTTTGLRRFTFLATDKDSYYARVAAFSPDGTRLVLYAYPHELSLWNTQTGTQVAFLTAAYGLGWASSQVDVAFSPNGQWFVVAGGAAQATLFRTKDAQVQQRLRGPLSPWGNGNLPRGSLAATFSADGRQVAVLHAGGEARLYAVPTGRGLAQARWANGPFAEFDRFWAGTLHLKGRILTGRSLNGSALMVTF